MHVRDQLYIDGKWVDTTRKGSIDVINPATEEIIGKVPVGSSEDVDKAVAAARSAFETWSKSDISQRIDVLNALSNAFKERGEELAQTITAEVGTPIGY